MDVLSQVIQAELMVDELVADNEEQGDDEEDKE